MRLLACALAISPLAASCGGPAPAASSRAISPEAATASARQHLPWFLERLAAADPADSGFRLVARMPAEGGRRSPDLTMRDIAMDGDGLFGTVVRADPAWPEYPEGRTFRFGPAVVVDWNFSHHELLIGGFQMRAQMCKLGEFLSGVQGRTAEAEAAVSDLRQQLDPSEACEPYDPRKDYGGG